MKETALLFPGQGSQEPGMGRDLAEGNAEIMDLWKKAERISKIRLREIYWDGDGEQMPLTRNLQPALTVTDLACWISIAGKCRPACAAGHSLGEYSALAAASVLPVDAIIELAALRGRLMSEADPEGRGAMAALLKLSREQVLEMVATIAKESDEPLVVANYNTPVQFVVSGTKKALEAVSTAVSDMKGRAVPLAVSGAFHSPLMNEAAAELASAINALPKSAWSNAKFPVYSNVTATPETHAEALKALLVRQMTSSVFWIDTIRNQWANGVRRFVECGPKTVLANMVGPNLKGIAPAAGEEGAPETLSVGTAQAAEAFV